MEMPLKNTINDGDLSILCSLTISSHLIYIILIINHFLHLVSPLLSSPLLSHHISPIYPSIHPHLSSTCIFTLHVKCV